MTGELSTSQSSASPQQSLAWGPCKHLRRRKPTFLDPAPGFPVKSPQPPQAAGTGSGKDVWNGSRTGHVPQPAGSPGRTLGPCHRRGPTRVLSFRFPSKLGTCSTWAKVWTLATLIPRVAERLLGASAFLQTSATEITIQTEEGEIPAPRFQTEPGPESYQFSRQQEGSAVETRQRARTSSGGESTRPVLGFCPSSFGLEPWPHPAPSRQAQRHLPE